MDEVNRQNSALVEESAAVARRLETSAAEVAEEVGFFNVGGDEDIAELAAVPPGQGANGSAERRLSA